MSSKTEFMINMVNKGLSVIPVKALWNDKKEIYSGKIPAVNNWQVHCDELTTIDDINSWNLNNTTGIGLCVGPASNLCCVDVDEKDNAIRTRLLETLPYTPLAIIGDPQKGGKFLYKMPYEYPQDILTIKNKIGNASIEFFFNRKQVVLPPSIHTMDKNKNVLIRYKWQNEKMAQDALNNLDLIPEFDPAYIEKAHIIIKNTSPLESIENNSPIVKSAEPVNSDESNLRYNDMKNFISGLFKSNVPLPLMVAKIREHDLNRNGDNLYFKDKSKGNKYDKMELNILSAIASFGNCFAENLNTGIEVISKLEDPFPPMDIEFKQEVKDISRDMLPKSALRYCDALHRTNGITYYGAYLTLLTALSPVIGNKRHIHPSPKNDFYVTPNIFMVLCQPSGTMKTMVLKTAMRFLNDIQERFDQDFTPVKQNYLREKEVSELILKEKEKELKQITTEINAVGGLASLENDSELKNDLDRVQSEIEYYREKLEAPTPKTYEINGATMERAMQIIEETKTGNLFYYEEQQELLNAQRQKGMERLRQFIMDGREGGQKRTHDTKTQGKNKIDELTLSLITATQPDVLSYHYQIAETKPLEKDGYWGRILVAFTDYATDTDDEVAYSHNSMTEVKNTFNLAYELDETDKKVFLDENCYDEYIKTKRRVKELTPKVAPDIRPLFAKMPTHLIAIAYLDALFRTGYDIKEVPEQSFILARKMFELTFQHIEYVKNYGVIEVIQKIIFAVQKGLIKEGDTVANLVKSNNLFKYPEFRDKYIIELEKRNVARIKNGKLYFNPEIYTATLNKNITTPLIS